MGPNATEAELWQRLEAAEAQIQQLQEQNVPGSTIRPASTSSANTSFFEGGSIAELMDQVEDQGKAIEKLETGLGQRVRVGNSGSTMRLSGRVHADYWAFPNTSPAANEFENGDVTASPEDRLGFRRLRFGVAGDVTDNMEYKIEMEFAAGDAVAFKDAYLGFNNLPLLHTVLIGNQKRPYGLDHLNSSRYNVFMERPFVVESFNQDARRLGVVSYGFTEDLAYNWRFGVYNQVDPQSIGIIIDDSYQAEVSGRFANTIWYDETSDGRGYAHWAVSGAYADPAAGPDSSARFRSRPESRSSSRWIDTDHIENAQDYVLGGLETVINLGRFQTVAEFMASDLERSGGASNLQFYGGYVYCSYFLTGEHMAWDRESGTLDRIVPFENFWRVRDCNGNIQQGIGAWQVAARYSHGDFSDDNVLGGVGDSVTGGLNWYWNPYARMQFNYTYGVIDERNVNGQTGGDYSTIGTRFMIDF